MTTIRLTMAQALVRFLAAQNSEIDGREYPLFAGVFAIFGHGNVAGLGEALYAARERLPTLRAHNEQAMALAAVAFAKASRRRRMMACTTSIGPGASNMVTAAGRRGQDRKPFGAAREDHSISLSLCSSGNHGARKGACVTNFPIQRCQLRKRISV